MEAEEFKGKLEKLLEGMMSDVEPLILRCCRSMVALSIEHIATGPEEVGKDNATTKTTNENQT